MDFAKDSARMMGSLAALDARTEASEKAILEAATKREAVVRSRLDELRPLVLTQAGASTEYQTLTLELRRLLITIGIAQRHLKKS